jgi:hypothetical protein
MGWEQVLKDVLQTTFARSVTEPVHHFQIQLGPPCLSAAAQTFSQPGKVQNPGSLISFLIVVQLHVPEPIWVGSRVKIASRL